MTADLNQLELASAICSGRRGSAEAGVSQFGDTEIPVLLRGFRGVYRPTGVTGFLPTRWWTDDR